MNMIIILGTFIIWIFRGETYNQIVPCLSTGKLIYSDSIAINIIIMIRWISLILMNCAHSPTHSFKKITSGLVGTIYFFCTFFFFSINIVVMFIIFEISIVPIISLILIFGRQPERLSAGIYMLFFTLTTRLPLFISILLIEINRRSANWMPGFSSNLNLILDSSPEIAAINLFQVFLFISFFAKIPVFFLHIWLPKAHLEASFLGSILLARIFLKIGIAGLSRVLSNLRTNEIVFNSTSTLFLGGGCVLSLTILFQVDIKRIIALASVVHISLCVTTLLTSTPSGDFVCAATSVGHRLGSSILFLINIIIYSIRGSRRLILSKSLTECAPYLVLLFSARVIINMNFPFSLTFIGEIMIIILLGSWRSIGFFLILAMSILNLISRIYIYWSLKKKAQDLIAKTQLPSNLGANCFFFLMPQRILFILLAFFF